jgi:hypothetical protein
MSPDEAPHQPAASALGQPIAVPPPPEKVVTEQPTELTNLSHNAPSTYGVDS